MRGCGVGVCIPSASVSDRSNVSIHPVAPCLPAAALLQLLLAYGAWKMTSGSPLSCPKIGVGGLRLQFESPKPPSCQGLVPLGAGVDVCWPGLSLACATHEYGVRRGVITQRFTETPRYYIRDSSDIYRTPNLPWRADENSLARQESPTSLLLILRLLPTETSRNFPKRVPYIWPPLRCILRNCDVERLAGGPRPPSDAALALPL
jgi:hypothetical protein